VAPQQGNTSLETVHRFTKNFIWNLEGKIQILSLMMPTSRFHLQQNEITFMTTYCSGLYCHYCSEQFLQSRYEINSISDLNETFFLYRRNLFMRQSDFSSRRNLREISSWFRRSHKKIENWGPKKSSNSIRGFSF
jgi:hypothetical protein